MDDKYAREEREAAGLRTMQERLFGSTGMRVSKLGLGCARIGGIFKSDPKEFVDVLCAAHDMGIRFFDTADIYSQGESELLLGRAFRRRRDQVILASKVGYCLPAQRQLIARIKPLVRPLLPLIKRLGIKRESLPSAVRGTLAQNFSPAYILSAVEASLRRLQTDHLDLLQLHSPPTEVVRQGPWMVAIEQLKASGKVRFFGISCDSEEAAEAALEVPGVASIQVVVNLLDTRFARAVIPAARARGVAVIARECLANGLLIKREADIDLTAYCRSPEQEDAWRSALASHRKQAAERAVPLARLAMDYASNVEGISVALLGVSRKEQLTAAMRDLLGGASE
jgi:aryl-alcohol dehydrogenase-like predicted oxidoreductase